MPATSSRKAHATRPATWRSGARATAVPRSSSEAPRLRWRAGMPAARPARGTAGRALPAAAHAQPHRCRRPAARAPGGHGPAAAQGRVLPPLIEAITERVRRGEQSLVLLNRRGFAPVLFCADCGWKSDCPHCSAHQVFHKADRTLRCHHCGFTQRVPRACPGCGNPDILPLGKGTEQLEEELARLLRNVQRPDREPARVARIDADTTRAKGHSSNSWPRCTRATSMCSWARRWWPRDTTSGASPWWPPSSPTAPCSPATTVRPSACSAC